MCVYLIIYLLLLLLSIFICCLCVLYIFSFDKCLERVLDLLEWRLKLIKPKGESLECSQVVKVFTSRPPSLLSRLVKAARVIHLPFYHDSSKMYESSTLISVTSREPFTSRQHAKDFKSHNFSDLSSFLVLRITLSTDVRIKWFKLLWKDNSEYYKFHKTLSWENIVWMDKNTLELAACAWMVTLGDGMMPFWVLEYN